MPRAATVLALLGAALCRARALAGLPPDGSTPLQWAVYHDDAGAGAEAARRRRRREGQPMPMA